MASKDPRAVDDAHDDEGATPAEQLFESCRRDNTSLLSTLLTSHASPDKLLNDSRTSLGLTALHVAVNFGSHEVLDALLDQEGLEVDPVSLMEGETPLHCAARYEDKEGEEGLGAHMVELLVEAGADPRIRNRGGQKPFDLVDPRAEDVRSMLEKAEHDLVLEAEVARQTKHGGVDLAAYAEGGGDEVGSGPESDDD